MSTNKKKLSMTLSIVVILVGCVFAFSSIIANEYLKLFIVLVAFAYGIYGVMRGLSSNPEEEEIKE